MPWKKTEAAIAKVDGELLRSLAVGATDEQLASLESKVKCNLPSDFKQAWKQHNGQTKEPLEEGQYQCSALFCMMEFLDTQEIYHEWDSVQEFCEDEYTAEAQGPVKADWWNSSWIPMVLIGGETRFFCLDLDPAPGGKYGQVIHATPKWEERRVVAESTQQFLELIAKSLEEGNYELNEGEIDICDALDI